MVESATRDRKVLSSTKGTARSDCNEVQSDDFSVVISLAAKPLARGSHRAAIAAIGRALIGNFREINLCLQIVQQETQVSPRTMLYLAESAVNVSYG